MPAAKPRSQATLIGVEELATQLGVGVRYVRRLVAERRVPYIKLGHLVRFDPAEIADWLERAKVEETTPDRRARPRAS